MPHERLKCAPWSIKEYAKKFLWGSLMEFNLALAYVMAEYVTSLLIVAPQPPLVLEG